MQRKCDAGAHQMSKRAIVTSLVEKARARNARILNHCKNIAYA